MDPGFTTLTSIDGAAVRYSCNRCSTYGTITPLVKSRNESGDAVWHCPKCKDKFGIEETPTTTRNLQ